MKKILKTLLLLVTFVILISSESPAQNKSKYEVIKDKKRLKAIVPASFYFAGLSGPTQRRNSAVAKLGEKRFIVAGLVDVSGYSTDISGVYEGFFITDSPVKFGRKKLKIGAYGIGFSKSGVARVFDLSGKQLFQTKTIADNRLKRPRPLIMTPDEKGIRLYKGRDYVVISPRKFKR